MSGHACMRLLNYGINRNSSFYTHLYYCRPLKQMKRFGNSMKMRITRNQKKKKNLLSKQNDKWHVLVAKHYVMTWATRNFLVSVGSRKVRQKDGNNFMNPWCRCGKTHKPDEGRKEKQSVRYFVSYNGPNSHNRCFKVSYFPFRLKLKKHWMFSETLHESSHFNAVLFKL